MIDDAWTLDESNGEVLVRTGVTGRAAKLGHRLTIAVTSWRGSVSWAESGPAAMEFTAEVESIEVLGGDGGVKSLSGPEKGVARSNALKSLDAKKSPVITFRASDVHASEGGYRIGGTLGIRGRERPCTIDLGVDDLGDAWRMSFSVVVRQSDFGITPYSLMLGALKVADDVTVSFSAERAKNC